MQHNVAVDSYVLLLCMAVPASHVREAENMRKNLNENLSDVFTFLKNDCVPVGELDKVTLEDLGDIVGRSRSTISDYTLGKINMKVQVTEDMFLAYGYHPGMFALPKTPIRRCG